MPLTTVNPAMIGQTSTGAASLTATGSAAASLVTAAGTALSADSSGRILTPFQPSCRYSRSGSAIYTSAAEFIYNLNRFDIGNCYSTSTGRFTAPVRGVYSAVANAYSQNGSGLASISLRQNGVATGAPNNQMSRNGSDYQTLYVAAFFFMEVGDYLSVNWEGGPIYIDNNCSFSVALLG